MTPRTRKSLDDKGKIRFTPSETKLIKATFYLSQENILFLEKIRIKYLETKKENIDKSALVRRAIELLAKQEGII